MKKQVWVGLLMFGCLSAFADRSETQCGKLIFAKVSGLEDLGFNYVLAQDNPNEMLKQDEIYFLLKPKSKKNKSLLRDTIENWDYESNTFPEVCIDVRKYYDALRTDGSSVRVVTGFRLEVPASN